MSEAAFVRKSLFVVGGLLIWAVHFTVIYVFNALACARHFHGVHVFGFGIVPLAIALITGVAVTAVVALLIVALRAPRRAHATRQPAAEFLNYLAAAVALLSIVAIGWSASPALLVPPCG